MFLWFTFRVSPEKHLDHWDQIISFHLKGKNNIVFDCLILYRAPIPLTRNIQQSNWVWSGTPVYDVKITLWACIPYWWGGSQYVKFLIEQEYLMQRWPLIQSVDTFKMWILSKQSFWPLYILGISRTSRTLVYFMATGRSRKIGQTTFHRGVESFWW